MVAIKTENLTKKYKDVTAVSGLNIEIKKGELVSLLGVNGAGKTTVIKMLCGLTQPTEGDAFLLGKSIVSNVSAVKKIIAVSPQETAVAPRLTVLENLQLICGIYGLSKEKQNEKITALLKKFGLTDIKNKAAGKLSGGQQRRVSIAMALISEPSILFLDEPTLGLDVIARSDLWDIIRALSGEITVILTTHYMEEAEALSDRVAILKEGRVLVFDTPENIKRLAKNDSFESAFINIVKGEVF